MHDLRPRCVRLACLVPLTALGLAACPPEPVATSTETSPSTGATVSTAETGTVITSGPTTGGVVTEPTTTTGSSTTTTGDTGESTQGVDGSSPGTSTTGTSTSTGSSTTALDETTTGSSTGTGSSTTAPLDTCGDGVLDPGELCDDGNKESGDGCLADCTPGVGAALGPLDLPPLDINALRRCLTLPGGADPSEHGLVLGGPLVYFGPDGQRAAYVERFPLPAANPVMWSWADYAGPNDRHIDELTTAENGDILAAGTVYTDPEQQGGFLWLARFTPEGELVWLRDHESIPSTPEDLAASPSGDMLVAARIAGWAQGAKGAWVHAFDAEGSLLWQHAAPTADEWRLWYTGITVDSDGSIYATGHGGPADGSFKHLVLESFSADGAALWQVELPSAKYPQATPSGITITSQGALVVAITQGADGWAGEESALAAFDTTGALLWWRDLPTKKNWYPYAGPIVAAPNGGVFVVWSDSINEDDVHDRVARYGANGEQLWAIDPASRYAVDAAFGPDGLLYVLQDQEVRRYVP